MGIRLSVPGIHLPDKIVDNFVLSRLVVTSDKWIVERTGIHTRRISLEMGLLDMGLAAVNNLLDIYPYKPDTIDLVIFVTNWRDNSLHDDSHAAYIARKIGTKRAVQCYDIHSACSGFVFAVEEAHKAINQNREIKRVLIIASKQVSDMLNFSDRETCILFGDAAAAVFVEQSGERGIIHSIRGQEQDTEGHLCYREKTGSKIRLNSAGSFETYPARQVYICMPGGKVVFKNAVKRMFEAVFEVLEPTDYTIADVDVIIPHGANIRIVDAIGKRLARSGFRGTMPTTIKEFGNTSAVSIPLSTAEAIKNGIIKDGDLVVNSAFGQGFEWGANLYIAGMGRENS